MYAYKGTEYKHTSFNNIWNEHQDNITYGKYTWLLVCVKFRIQKWRQEGLLFIYCIPWSNRGHKNKQHTTNAWLLIYRDSL